MYKPRRTSEFHEETRENGGAIKRRQIRSHFPQPRFTQFSPAGSTQRNSTLSSATPLRHRQASSVERALPLHLDKKWVQDQSQLIAEYLDEMMHSQAQLQSQQWQPLQGFSKDYFSRGAIALRQMTTKQFVSIVKFFFQFVFGSRVNVGSNFLEDIPNALYKIKYPHVMNKSCVMTPTTKSSLGHVIVMFDFLKDLAPPSAKEFENEEFPFMETNDLNDNSTDRSLSHMHAANATVSSIVLNEETNHLLFASAAQSFCVWDTQSGDEYAALNHHASERIIKSLTDLPNLGALDAELVRLKSERKQLDDQLLLRTVDNKQEQLLQLRAQKQQLQDELQIVRNNTHEQAEKMSQLRESYKEHAARLEAQRKDLQQLQREVTEQRYTAQDLENLKVILSDLKNEQSFYKREMDNCTEFHNNQQVYLARAKKKLLDKVGKFNLYARNIELDSDVCSACENEELNLVLPFSVHLSDIEIRSRRLQQLATLLEQHKKRNEKLCLQLEQDNAKSLQSNSQLEAEMCKLNSFIEAHAVHSNRLTATLKSRMSKRTHHQKHLIQQKLELNTKLEQQRQANGNLEQQLQAKRQEIEDILSAAEQRQNERLEAQKAFIAEQNAAMAQNEMQLNEIRAKVAENAIELENLQLELERMEPLSSQINAVISNVE